MALSPTRPLLLGCALALAGCADDGTATGTATDSSSTSLSTVGSTGNATNTTQPTTSTTQSTTEGSGGVTSGGCQPFIGMWCGVLAPHRSIWSRKASTSSAAFP